MLKNLQNQSFFKILLLTHIYLCKNTTVIYRCDHTKKVEKGFLMIHKIPVSAFFTIDDTFSWGIILHFAGLYYKLHLSFRRKNAGLF